MVEFAIVVIPLLGLLFGIIEFGWSLNQQQDVRYGAREGARNAAVSNNSGSNAAPTAQQLVTAVCSRMDSASSAMRVSFIATPSVPAAGPQTGDTAVVQVVKPLQQITGFYSWLLDNDVIRSSVTFRLEQPPTWSNTSPVTVSGSTISGGLACP
jgi:Flp pilus assembly protein TadG